MSQNNKDNQEHSAFNQHLANASKIVSTWPEWKKNVLGYGKPDKVTPSSNIGSEQSSSKKE